MVRTLYMIRSLFYLFGGPTAFFLYFASGLVELRAGLAIELFDAVLELVGGVLGLTFHFATSFARPLIGAFLIGG